MNGRALVSGLQRFLGGVVLAVSGGYMLIYLYRWEWNRAIISGLFFVSAEIALASSMILRRLRSLEQQPAARPEAASAVYETLRGGEVERPNPFRWLTDATSGNTLPVLVPVLIGAGAVLSAIAYVVERIAEATALPAFDRQVAQRLATMAPPPTGLLSGPVDPVPTPPPMLAPGEHRSVRLIVMLATLAVLGWMGGNALVEGAQTRPDPAERPASTTIDLAISSRRGQPPATATADALWLVCRSTLRSLPVTADVEAHGADGAALVLRPGVGRHALRRLTGCLGDIRLDLVRADVIRTVSVAS